MDPIEQPKSAPSKKGSKKPSARELESRIAEMMVARDAEQKKAMELHAGVQDLSRRTGELEAQLGEQDEELQASRKQAEEAGARSAALEKEAAALRGDRDAAQQELARLRLQVSDLQKAGRDLEASAAKTSALEKEAATLREQLARTQAESKKAQEQRDAVELEKTRLKTDAGAAAGLQKELDQTREEAEGVARLLDEAEAELEKVRGEAAASAARIGDLELQRSAAQHKSEAAETRSSELESVAAGLEEELQNAAEDIAKSEARAAELQQRVGELDPELQKAWEDADRSAALIAGLEEQKAGLRRQVEELTGARDQARKLLEEARQRVMQFTEEHHELAGKREELRTGLEAAQKQNAELESRIAALQAQLKGAEVQGVEAKRRIEELQHDLSEAKPWEGKAKEAELAATQARQNAAERLADLVRFEKTRLEQERRIADLKAALAEVKKGAAPAEEPEPIVMPEPADPDAGPVDDILAPSAPPPPAEAVPHSADETTLRPQNLFGPLGADGQASYILMELLSKDALGVLYRARERATDRQFAVRFLAGQAGESQTAAIEHTAEKLTALPHPNILHVQGSGTRKNRPYLAMDLVEAQTLGQSKIQEIPRIAAILRDAAAAVHYAHEEGVFHGDLNPEAILVAREDGKDHALVKDFGLAFLLETAPASTPSKDAVPAIRNPAYLAPEQARILKPALGAATDVYGLGVTLYAALAGKPPFEGKDAAQILKRVMIEEPIPLQRARPGLPEALGAIVRRAMAKERGLRYASAQEMADALGKFLESSAPAEAR